MIQLVTVNIKNGFNSMEDLLTAHPDMLLNTTSNATTTPSIKDIALLASNISRISHNGINILYNSVDGALSIWKSNASLMQVGEVESALRNVVYANYESSPSRQQKTVELLVNEPLSKSLPISMRIKVVHVDGSRKPQVETTSVSIVEVCYVG